MPALNSFATVFHQRAAKEIEDRIQTLAIDLVDGSARGSDFNATAQEYVRVVGHIYGLREALKICKHVEDDLTGKTGDTKAR